MSVSRNSALAAAKHLLLVGFRRADWPTVWGSVQVCCGIFFLCYFMHWQMGNGRRVGKGRVRKVEEEAGYGKLSLIHISEPTRQAGV